VLTEALADQSADVRRHAARPWDAGAAGRGAVRLAGRWPTRTCGARQRRRGLGEVGPAAKEAIPALAKALADPDAEITRLAASALTHLGKEAVPAWWGCSRTRTGRCAGRRPRPGQHGRRRRRGAGPDRALSDRSNPSAGVRHGAGGHRRPGESRRAGAGKALKDPSGFVRSHAPRPGQLGPEARPPCRSSSPP